MPDIILGLDIGKYSVKVVVVKRNTKYTQIMASRTLPITDETDLANALKFIAEDESFQHDRCVVSLPSHLFSFRNLSFPFCNIRKIEQALRYELEPLIPFPIDDVLTDYQVIERADLTNILCGSIPTSYVNETISMLSGIGLKTPIMDIEGVPIAMKLIKNGMVRSGSNILLNIGTCNTTAFFFDNEKIVSIRNLKFGSDKIAEFTPTLPPPDKNKTEENNAYEAFENFLLQSSSTLPDFFNEILTTYRLLQFKEVAASPLSSIFLTGVSSLCAGLKGRMEAFFPVPVELVDISAIEKVRMSDEIRSNWIPPVLNNALSLAMRDLTKEGGFNFGSSKGVSSSGIAQIRKETKLIAICTLIVTLTLGSDIFLDYRLRHRHLSELRTRTKQIFHETCPEVQRIVDPVQQLKIKLSEINQSEADQRIRLGIRVVDLLRDISQLIPSTVDFLITSFVCDGENVDLRGETDTFNTVDIIKSHLENSPYAQNVTINSASTKKNKTGIEFSLKMELKLR